MALLRLMLVTLAACGQAGAQPSATSGLKAPVGWIAIPEIATAVAAAAKTEGTTVDGAEAWGDPARGCYGVWLAIHGDGASAEQVLAGLASQPITTTNDPGFTRAVLSAAPTPVVTPQPMSAS